MQVPATKRPQAQFGTYEVDFASRELRNHGRRINLQEKPFQILVLLLDQPGELVTREDLRRQLWPADTFVDFEHSINTAIMKLREALEDQADEPRFIETLPKRGYRFIAPVTTSGQYHAATPLAAEPQGTDAVVNPQAEEVEAYLGSLESDAHRNQSLRRWTSRRHLLVGALILVIMGVAAGIWFRYVRRNISAATATPSIAVLPFTDLSPGHDQEYFSDGLAEELLNSLTRIPDLKVVARTSAFQFKGKGEDCRTIGHKLNVTTFLEGSVRKEGNHIRVTVQLIKAGDCFHLWSESYDRDLKQVFAVEDDIARAVTSALQPKLLARESSTTLPSSRTTSPDAYQVFLQARYFARQRDDNASAQEALTYLDRTIELDPTYAPAYALRGTMTAEAGFMGRMNLPSAINKARHDAEEAIRLDPNLAAGYLALSETQALATWDWKGAEQSVRKARELAPGDAYALWQSAFLAWCWGRLEEADDLTRQALALDSGQGLAVDPLQANYTGLGQILRDLGRYEEAHAALEKSVQLNPHQVWTHEVRGEVYLAQERPQEALAEMEKEPERAWREFGTALAYHALGRHSESDAALAALIAHDQDDAAYQVAEVHAYRGETDQAFVWLDRALRQRDAGLGHLRTERLLKNLRNDPRYASLLKKVNLAD